MAETAQYSWVNQLVNNYNSQRTGNLFPAPGPYVLKKGDVPRGAGLSVKTMEHVEMDYAAPSGYEPKQTMMGKDGPYPVPSRVGARTFAGGRGYGL